MGDRSDELEQLERKRLAALVAADVDAALSFHHEEFQLITPRGTVRSRSEYLHEIGSGSVRYLSWQPEEIVVRLTGLSGVLRYRAILEMVVDGVHIPPFRCWHTDLYDWVAGRWLVVWSQATLVDQVENAYSTETSRSA